MFSSLNSVRWTCSGISIKEQCCSDLCSGISLVELSADLERDFPWCVSLGPWRGIFFGSAGLVEFSSSIVYLIFWKSFVVNRRKDVFGIKSLMLRSNYNVYPWKTLSLWCVTGFWLRNYCHPGLSVVANLFQWERIVPLFLSAQLTSFLTHEYTAWLPWSAFVYSRTSPFTLTTRHFVRLCKVFYIQ